jgi:hypothetical protein
MAKFRTCDYNQMNILPVSIDNQISRIKGFVKETRDFKALKNTKEQQTEGRQITGKVKVNIQWKLFCMVHNLEKIVNFGNSFAFATQ